MLQLTIPESKGILFETGLEPASSAVDRLRKDLGVDEGEITTFRGKKNKVAVGLPYYENLISRYHDQNQEIPHEIKNMMNKFDFYYVRVSCTFQPDKDCIFNWARFGVELSAESKSGEAISIKPIVHHLFPGEVNSEIKYKREVSITPELKLNLFEVVDAGVGANVSKSKEFVIYEPKIIGSGINRSTVAWDFYKTEESGIRGDRISLLVVRTPKDSKVKGRFLLGGEVSSHLSKLIPLSTRKDSVVDKEYALSE